MAKRKAPQPQAPVEPPRPRVEGRLRVFISWSGDRSKAVANALRGWLGLIVQGVEPWVSTHDIAAGRRWSSELAGELDGSNFGILCLTPENVREPWILFEAGALSKSVADGRVVPYLLGLVPSDVEHPLGQFNGLVADETGTLTLVRNLNQAMGSPLADSALEILFEGMWPKLREKLDLAAPKAPAGPLRTVEEILEELVTSVRGMSSILESRPWERPSTFARGQIEPPGATFEDRFLDEIIDRARSLVPGIVLGRNKAHSRMSDEERAMLVSKLMAMATGFSEDSRAREARDLARIINDQISDPNYKHPRLVPRAPGDPMMDAR